jgi:uncharacterized protein (TIGR02301 family)
MHRLATLLLSISCLATPALAQESPMRVTPPPLEQRAAPQAAPRTPARPPIAQQPRRPATTPQTTAPKPADAPAVPTVPPPYELPLIELSEAIGSLAFLTGLCAPSPEPNAWQKRMESLIESEGQVVSTREKMMGAYNQGFLAFQTAHRECSTAARTARGLLVRDAARIARNIERRWGS